MRLDNLLSLIRGTLRTSPQISEFDNITIRASKVKRGSLFIAVNRFDIDEAVANGAYGIIYERNTITPNDDETAWIEVADIYNALKRIIRFLLIDKDIRTYRCDTLTLDIAKRFATKNDLIILQGSLSENFTKLLGAKPDTVLFFESSTINDTLFSDAKRLQVVSQKNITYLKSTLFESKFLYKNALYEIDRLSPLFVPAVAAVIDTLQRHAISFQIRSFAGFEHFVPKFVDRSLHVKEFGTSEQVLIFETHATLFEQQIAFLQERTPWANSIVLLKKDIEDEATLFRILGKKRYNFAYLGGFRPDILTTAHIHFEAKQLQFAF